MADESKGVLAQHRDRSANETDYHDAAMTAPSITDKTGISAKYLPGTAPTVPAARHGSDANTSTSDQYADLKGDALDQAVKDAGITGYSSMSADEKRQALRDQA